MAKAAVEQKRNHPKTPQHPQQRKKTTQARLARPRLFVAAIGLVALVAIGLVLMRGLGEDATRAAAAPLPDTSDYHSLLVAPNAPDQPCSARIRVSSARPMAVGAGRRPSLPTRTR